jgi:hypothetical protein
MSQHAIVKKLDKHTREGINSEAAVVYFLVEVRKLLELRSRERKANKQPADHSFATLEFCCDWAVHPVMDWENGKRIVRRFDKYQELIDSQKAVADLGFLKEFGETIRLSKFRTQLAAFLKSEHLESTLAEDSTTWINFLKYYAPVIEDCPLRCFDEGLRHTEEVTLKVLDVRAEEGGEYQLMIEWTWLSKSTGMTTNNVQIY